MLPIKSMRRSYLILLPVLLVLASELHLVLGANLHLRGKSAQETATSEGRTTSKRLLHSNPDEHRRRLSVLDYWTDEKIKRAIPRDALVDKPADNPNARRQRRNLLQAHDLTSQTSLTRHLHEPNRFLLSPWGDSKFVECTVQHEPLSSTVMVESDKGQALDSTRRELANAKPKDRHIAPRDNAVLNTQYVDLVVEINDPDGGDDLSMIILFLDNYESISQSTFSPDLGNAVYTFTIGPLKDGDYRWSVIAKDRRGKQSGKGADHFTIDSSFTGEIDAAPTPSTRIPPFVTATTPTMATTTTTATTTTSTTRRQPFPPNSPPNPPALPNLPSVTAPTVPATTNAPPPDDVAQTTSTVQSPPNTLIPPSTTTSSTGPPPLTVLPDGIFTTAAPPWTQPTPPRTPPAAITTPTHPTTTSEDVSFEYLQPAPQVHLKSNQVTFQWKLQPLSSQARITMVLLRVQYPGGDEGYLTRLPTRNGMDTMTVNLDESGTYGWSIWAQVNDGVYQKGPWGSFERETGPSDPACPERLKRYTNRNQDLHKAVGRIVFRLGNDNYLCSGTLVEGANDRAIIATAAHCIYDQKLQAFPDQMLFIPGQDDGGDDTSDFRCSNDPHGCFYPKLGIISDKYQQATFSFGFEYDYGFLVAEDESPGMDVAPDRETFGGDVYKTLKPMPITFEGMEYGRTSHLFGYPGARDPLFMYSSGRADKSPITEGGWYVQCSGLTAGASGGPWTQSDPSTGEIVVASVNSWGWTNGDPGMGSPPFDTGGAECVYNNAITANLNSARSLVAQCPE